MRYVLDTNIIFAFLRKHPIWDTMEEKLHFFDPTTLVFVPAVVMGEIQSIAIQNKWGFQKKETLEKFLDEFIKINYLSQEVIYRYAEIDAYSQGRSEEKRLMGSAKNMGKNDLWIAATASVLEATLITTDRDYDHLHDQFLRVACFDLK